MGYSLTGDKISIFELTNNLIKCMADKKKTILKTKFKDGEKVEGTLTSIEDGYVLIETEDKTIHIPLPSDICAALESFEDQEIILSKKDGEYEIEEKD